MSQNNTIHSTTQDFLDIYDIVNDILILKDASAALILGVDAVNFGLLAEAEQDAIIYSYAGLLNSLNYPIQILIVSKTKDVSNYLGSLEEQEINSLNENKKNQIREYRQFVSELIKERNVLDKKFYAVIPTSALELGLLSAQSVIPGIRPKAIENFDKSIVLDKAITNLYPKRDHLVAQFARIGLFAKQLSTQEIIQLFYVSYNPEATEGQEITDSNSYSTALVETIHKGATMVNAIIPNNPIAEGDTSNQNPTTNNTITPPTNPTTPVVPTAQTTLEVTPPPVSQPLTPTSTAPVSVPVEPASNPMQTPTGDELKDVQGTINNTVQELGVGTNETSAPSAPVIPNIPVVSSTTATTVDTPAVNTPPPLPEI